jgi:hypothetical protein
MSLYIGNLTRVNSSFGVDFFKKRLLYGASWEGDPLFFVPIRVGFGVED